MMSCTASAAWSHHVSSPCYTEHGQHCGAVLSDCITTVAMYRSGQLGLRCSVEPNCSGMSAHLAGASVTHDRALDTCEPSCVPGAAGPLFIHVVHSPLGAVGYVATPELSSRRGRAGPRGSTGAHLGREARFRAEEHVAASELSSQEGRARSHGTCGSARAHLSREARSGAKEYVAAPELNPARRQDPEPRATWQHRSSPQQGGDVRDRGTRGGSEAHLYREVWSKAIYYVAVRRCMPYSLS
jgi:hypothetical protein